MAGLARPSPSKEASMRYRRYNNPYIGNELPVKDKTLDCGDAAKDGYTVLSRANRMTGTRPPIGEHEPPNFIYDL
jgi:hypothetical protein